MSKAQDVINLFEGEGEEITFNKKNFMNLLKSGKGIVVFGTGGGYPDTSEFKVPKDKDVSGKEDMLFVNASRIVAGAKDSKMKGRQFKVRSND